MKLQKQLSGGVFKKRCKKGLLKKFTKFTRRHLCQSYIFNKVASLGLQLYLKKDFGTGIFL